MEYSYNNLEKAIYYCLTLHKNEPISYINLYNEVRGVCKELSSYGTVGRDKFKNLCDTMYIKYEDVYNFKICNTDHMIFTTKTRAELESEYGIKISKYTSAPVHVTQSIDNLAINKQWLKLFRPDDQYDAIDTFLHAVCRNCCVEIFDQIVEEYTDVDTSIRNQNDESLFDVIPKTEKGFDMVVSLLSYEMNTETLSLTQKLADCDYDNKNLICHRDIYQKMYYKSEITNRILRMIIFLLLAAIFYYFIF